MKDCVVTACKRCEIPCLNRLRSKGCRLTNGGMQQMLGEKESVKSCGFLTLLKIQISRDGHRGTKRQGEGGPRDQVQIKIDLKHINLKK